MKLFSLISVYLTAVFSGFFAAGQTPVFVKVKDHRFFISNQPYYFIGANIWYAGLLSVSDAVKGKERLVRELDFLKDNGVINLRVIAGGEGTGKINGVSRITPALQPDAGIFNEDLLKGLDFLLVEMGKRNMKAVIYLSNNWEWSGGFLQYLNWNGLLPDSVMKRKLSWDEMRDYISLFYQCQPCMRQYEAQLKLVVNRKNLLTGKMYTDDPAIMAWEIANEPRPMREAAIPNYIKWISQTASLIKSLDHHHLVTIGSEGEMGSESLDLFKQIHADKNIDYLTIHVWPKNWGWFKDTAIAKDMDIVLDNTVNYIARHVKVAEELDKPLVLEEFGLPRDNHLFEPGSPVGLRDQYYELIFRQAFNSIKEGGVIAGSNFWSFGGEGRPSHKQLLWAPGDDLLGDPPVEEQGLNSVFDNDASTWKVIKLFANQINDFNAHAE